MRASDVRTSIVAVVEAASVDAAAGARDRFVYVDTGGKELEQSPDRVFRCWLSVPPRRTTLFTLSAYEVEYTIDIHYAAVRNVDDRAAHDLEQVAYDLQTLNAQHADIMAAAIQPGSVLEMEHMIVARIPVLVTYRLTGVS